MASDDKKNFGARCVGLMSSFPRSCDETEQFENSKKTRWVYLFFHGPDRLFYLSQLLCKSAHAAARWETKNTMLFLSNYACRQTPPTLEVADEFALLDS